MVGRWNSLISGGDQNLLMTMASSSAHYIVSANNTAIEKLVWLTSKILKTSFACSDLFSFKWFGFFRCRGSQSKTSDRFQYQYCSWISLSLWSKIDTCSNSSDDLIFTKWSGIPSKERNTKSLATSWDLKDWTENLLSLYRWHSTWPA